MDDQRKDDIDSEDLPREQPPKPTEASPARKILTVQIREEIYYWLTSRGLFPDEHKGCRKGSRGSAELLYIEQHILNKSKTRRKNPAMTWIDHKNVYDIVLQSWIIKCLKMYKISDEVINFIVKTMKTWRVELTAGEEA